MIKTVNLNSETFTRWVEDIITVDELKKLLQKGVPLRVKYGIDVTSPDLHLGHASFLWKLRSLQEAGHKAVIILGDVTTRIGDPTGRTKTRPTLTQDKISRNIVSIRKQIRGILLTDRKVLELRKSSEWYSRMKATDFLDVISHITHARLIGRDMFQKRLKDGEEIFIHELIYPVLQGYDSVALKSDLTIIGSDQLFNEHMGRFLQGKFGQVPQSIVTLKIIPGTDGREKMSKSLGNSINLADTPEEKFGKVMSIKDNLILDYLEACTDISMSEVERSRKKFKEGANPMGLKLFLAEAIVRRYHGEKISRREKERFLNLFSKKQLTDIPIMYIKVGKQNLLELLGKLHLVSSKSEARRLLGQGAVEVDGRVVREPLHEVKDNSVIKVGKRRFVKIKSL